MALGTNYKKSGDRDDQRIKRNLARLHNLTQRYIKEGMADKAASKKAFKDITGYENRN